MFLSLIGKLKSILKENNKSDKRNCFLYTKLMIETLSLKVLTNKVKIYMVKQKIKLLK